MQLRGCVLQGQAQYSSWFVATCSDSAAEVETRILTSQDQQMMTENIQTHQVLLASAVWMDPGLL